MLIDSGAIIDVLYIRGPVSAPGIAAELGDDFDSIDVSGELMDLLLKGFVEEVRAQPPRWRLTEPGIEIAWKRKARQEG